MGYNTSFKGELKFVHELSLPQSVKLKSLLGEDCRDHPEWNRVDLTYIDLELNNDLTGIKWDGAEKTYGLAEKVNVVIDEMQKVFPEFGLTGAMLAQGEEAGDVWILKIENGRAIKTEIKVDVEKITCPHCHKEFQP